MVDSTRTTFVCPTFATNVTVGGICPGGNTACLNPGLDWANNNTCGSINGCSGFDDDGFQTATDRMVFVAYTTSSGAGYTAKMLADTVAFDTTNTRYTYNNSVGTNHALFTMTAPAINTATCNGTSCNITVKITEPNFDSTGAIGGLYGDDAGVAGGFTQSQLAGYKIIAKQFAVPPTDALTSTGGQWVGSIAIAGTSRYIPATRPPAGATLTSGTITIPVSGANTLYVAWVPVFNFSDSACTGATQCLDTDVQGLDTNFGGTAINSMSGRIASAASTGISPTPVQFVSFTGQLIRPKLVRLTWVTASESNSAGFNLYRSEDGANWTTVNSALIPAKGVGGAGATYTYDDTGVKPSLKKLQYRLDEVSMQNAVTSTISTQVQRHIFQQ
jgi:hypothetical protein